ncbi:DUF4245 domain-containing protein [Ornithinimicrobium sp. LYQ121]|uniref:DUF4245 domain-containing protein n=1 Tax=Ornithinimicrobium sp. LYQ121 TaxID=3378801 RepID=UPI0038529947
MSTPQPPAVDEQAPSGGGPRPDPDAGRKRLATYTVRNMVFSTLILLAVVLVLWSMTFNPAESQRRTPDVAQPAAHAAEEATFPVWVPAPGEGWTPTVVWYDARVAEVQTWHVSYVSPEGAYVAVHQAADVTDEWLAEVLPEAQADGAVRLTGPQGEQEWQRWSGPSDGNAEVGYVLGPEETGGSTVVVHGTADQAEFETFLVTITAED